MPETALPDPEVTPIVDLWPTAGRALDLGRNATYKAARAGTIPTIRAGHRWLVPTAALRRLLGLDGDQERAS
jgi:hypothetical protein